MYRCAWFARLALRLWLTLTLMLTSVHVPYAMSEKAMGFLSWLPLHSATLLFGSVGILIALMLGAGFATRLAALLGIIIVSYRAAMAGDVSFPFYWITILALLLTLGPGKISLDYALLSHLKLRFPQAAACCHCRGRFWRCCLRQGSPSCARESNVDRQP